MNPATGGGLIWVHWAEMLLEKYRLLVAGVQHQLAPLEASAFSGGYTSPNHSLLYSPLSGSQGGSMSPYSATSPMASPRRSESEAEDGEAVYSEEEDEEPEPFAAAPPCAPPPMLVAPPAFDPLVASPVPPPRMPAALPPPMPFQMGGGVVGGGGGQAEEESSDDDSSDDDMLDGLEEAA